MATTFGKNEHSFSKPYLNMIVKVLEDETPLELVVKGGTIKQKINKTEEIQKLITAIKSNNETKVISILKSGSLFAPIFNGYKWSDILKAPFSGQGGGKPDGQTTARQERASLYAIQKSIEKNGYTDKKKFFTEHRQELLNIYPEMNEEWEETFFQQQLTTYREVGNTKYSHYSRDGGFMEWITNFAKKYGVSKKDNWNPADIWLISDEKKVKDDIKRRISDDYTSIEEFNSILRDMFSERRVIGISLKKLSGKTADWEVVNMKKFDMFDDEQYVFKLDSIECKLTMKGKSDFSSSDTMIYASSKKMKVKIQVRPNSKGFSNMKLEGTDISATSARLGKAPLDMVEMAFKKMGLKFDNQHQNFPSNSTEFEKDYVTVWKPIFNKVKKYTGITDDKIFNKNMIEVFNGKNPDFANNKLIQMKMLAEMVSLTDDKLNRLVTHIIYLAQKKGDVFGPFAKLY